MYDTKRQEFKIENFKYVLWMLASIGCIIIIIVIKLILFPTIQKQNFHFQNLVLL